MEMEKDCYQCEHYFLCKYMAAARQLKYKRNEIRVLWKRIKCDNHARQKDA